MPYGASWMAQHELHALPPKCGSALARSSSQDVDLDATPAGHDLGLGRLAMTPPDDVSGDATPRGLPPKLGGGFGFDDAEEDSVRTPRTTSRGGYTATWARLRSPSPPGAQASALAAAARVEWRPVERGLPVLPRAWRTPDPSPTRDGNEVLPAAKLAQLAYADDGCGQDEEAWAMARTPSPEHGLPPPPVMPGSFATRRPTTPRGRLGQVPVTPPLQEEALKVDPPPSAGSCGHPDQCGAPCKYFWKANGCKDGAACERCHLCKWVRPRKKPELAAAPVPPAAPMVLEISRSVEAKPRQRELPRLLLSEMVF